jgi:transposase-like protein
MLLHTHLYHGWQNSAHGGWTAPYRSPAGLQALLEAQGSSFDLLLGRRTYAARRAYRSFVAKWTRLVPAVVESLEEAGEELLTFYRFPKEQWKSLRTTNIVGRLNGEFRRRTKTQGSFSTETSALALLWGLVVSGTIEMRKIDGHYKLAEVTKNVA